MGRVGRRRRGRRGVKEKGDIFISVYLSTQKEKPRPQRDSDMCLGKVRQRVRP